MKILKSNLCEKLTVFIFALVLFFPTKYFSIYYGLITLFVVSIYFIGNQGLTKNLYFNFFAVLISLIFINSALSSIYFSSNIFRNLTEVIRYIPVLMMVSSYRSFNIRFSYIFMVLCFYTIIATTINYLQFINVGFVASVSEFYNDPAHIENSLELANRSLGLSSGPGPNGIVFVIILIFFLISLLLGKKIKISLLMIVLSSISIFCSQSQTAFVALGLTLFFTIFILFPKNYNKKYFYYTSISFFTILVISVTYLWKNIENFKYLNTLFEQGLNRSSYQNREVKIDSTMNLIDQNNLFYLIGHAKDYIPNSSALDNEYLFFISVYGVLGLILILFFYSYNIVYLYFNKVESIYKYLIICSCFSGLIIAWPSSFILDPRILLILTIYFTCYLNVVKGE